MFPKKLKVGALLFVKPRAVGSQRLLSNFSAKSSMSISMKPNAEMGVAKEKTVKDRISVTESVGHDSDSFERMTIKEPRAKLRSIGVPAKGCKRDLVSALWNSTNNNNGEDSLLIVEDKLSSKVKQIHSENRFKRKAKSVSSEDHAETLSKVSKVPRRKQIKGRGEQAPIEGEDSLAIVEGSVSSIIESISSEQHAKRNGRSFSTEEHTEDITTVSEISRGKWAKQRVKPSLVKSSNAEVQSVAHATKLSTKTIEVAGKKPKRIKRTGPQRNSPVNIGASEKVDLLENKIEPWTMLAHKKPQKGWIAYNPKTMRPPPLSADKNNVKLMSWNVNGLRALLKLEGFSALELAQREDFDVLCLQETKLQEKDVEAIRQTLLEGYGNSYWTCSVSKLGYSGTAIISRIPPLSVRYGLGISDHDSEGRLVTAEFDTFYLLCAYVPNSSEGLKRLSYRVTEWDLSLGSYMKELEKSKPVILTGDLNCAHEEIDIFNPAGNKRSAGFTIEERMSFETNLLNNGFVDTFRKQHPGVVGYTYWGYRHGGRKTNKGWRLDYFLVSESIADNVHDSYILPDVTGSDHCPIGLVLKL